VFLVDRAPVPRFAATGTGWGGKLLGGGPCGGNRGPLEVYLLTRFDPVFGHWDAIWAPK